MGLVMTRWYGLRSYEATLPTGLCIAERDGNVH